MANQDLVVLENQLQPLLPLLNEALAGTLPVERLARTVLISCERNPKLLQCDRQSLFNSAMSAAVLGLEVDGVTGQAFLIPFGNKAQLVIGYKGYNTIGARSGITIRGGVVREGDIFDYDLGTGLVTHKPDLKSSDPNRRITAAWAQAARTNAPPILSVLSMAELLAIKTKSPGAKKSDSPWNDPPIGFPAMCEKSAKRRLARSMPLNVFQWAARMEEAFEEQGLHSRITRDGPVIEQLAHQPETPSEKELTTRSSHSGHEREDATAPSSGSEQPSSPAPDEGPPPPTAEAYISKWQTMMDSEHATVRGLSDMWNAETDLRNRIEWDSREQRLELGSKVSKKIVDLGGVPKKKKS